MVNQFKVNLRYGFQADLWFEDLLSTEKDMYTHLVAAFKKQWPLTKQPKAWKAERARTLKEWTLMAESLGKKVEGAGGSQVYAHVQWANSLAAHVRDAGDTGGFALGEVFNALPQPIKNLIRKELCTTYKELAEAVLTINIGDLRDSAQDYLHDEETARLTRAPPSPTKVVHIRLTTTHIQTPQHTYQQPGPTPTIIQPAPLPMNVFTSARGRGNLFPLVTQRGMPSHRGMSLGSLGIG